MVVTYANVVALIVAVLFGVLALSEPLPQVLCCALSTSLQAGCACVLRLGV